MEDVMTPEEMEKRLLLLEQKQQVTEDIEAIKQLHYHYMNAFMKADWDQVLGCFAEDCLLDVLPGADPVRGITEIEKVFRGTLAKTHVGKEGDFILHPIIHVNGDKAKGNWTMYMMWAHKSTWQPLFWLRGEYNAEYSRIDGQWKFSYLQHQPRFGPTQDIRKNVEGYA